MSDWKYAYVSYTSILLNNTIYSIISVWKKRVMEDICEMWDFFNLFHLGEF